MKLRVATTSAREALDEVLHLACVRSYTRSLVEQIRIDEIAASDPVLCVIGEPGDAAEKSLSEACNRPRSKVALFGALGSRVAARLGIALRSLDPGLAARATCPPAPVGGVAKSALRIRYARAGLGLASPVRERPFARHDFAAEWNNLGYGAVRADGSIWSLSQLAEAPSANVIATVLSGSEPVSAFAAIFDFPASSVLWINRAAGTVDSAEWKLVEAFFSDYRPDELACLPKISEIPAGCDAAVTMRLDCDEDVASAEPLRERYRVLGVPLSLAIRTDQLADARHHAIVKRVASDGGSILSHSHTHLANWGADFEEARREASLSRQELAALVGDAHVRYAVSPFHQNPPHAVRALAAAGFHGFVGGIVANDPQYLLGRAGEVPAGPPGFVSHSQQCMLHGDCVPADGDALRIYKQSFEIARRARSIFGYLDHPFSARYQYAWKSESERIGMHEALIGHIRACGRVAFLSENEALDFVRARAAARVRVNGDGTCLVEPDDPRFAIEHKGRVRRLDEKVVS